MHTDRAPFAEMCEKDASINAQQFNGMIFLQAKRISFEWQQELIEILFLYSPVSI